MTLQTPDFAPLDWVRGEYTVSTDRERLDFRFIADALATSYWAANRDRATIARSFSHSLVFGLYRNTEQAGFCRVVTDYATFAYLADVWIDPEIRGLGLGKWLVEAALGHPELAEIGTWCLKTNDAHGLYEQVGFVPLPTPERWMCRGQTPGDLAYDPSP